MSRQQDLDYAIYGDTGPWVRHLATAWRAAAGSPDSSALPSDPTDSFLRAARDGDPVGQERDDVAAYWGPLLHLTCYGLGWTRPDLGLHRWLETGCPADDPVLRVINLWWGPHRVRDFLAWAATNDALSTVGHELLYPDVEEAPRRNTSRLPDDYATRRREADWQLVWGGGLDPLHLLQHAASPSRLPDIGKARPLDATPYGPWIAPAENERVHRAIITSTYAGWYLLFWHYQWRREHNKAVQVDITARPIGWLGAFRYSRCTGVWFRGRRHHHLLGN